MTARRVVVAGSGVAGRACEQALRQRGVEVAVVVDPVPPDALDGAAELVVSPGFAPHHPLVVEATRRGLPVYSEPELAWRLQHADLDDPAGGGALPGPGRTAPPGPVWLGVTGTNGKTTTTTMLAAILSAAGHRVAALGNIGEPLVTAVAGRPPRDVEVLAVELSSFQLHWSRDLAVSAGVLLNLADDHLDWHGSFAAYQAAKEAIWRSATPERGGMALGNLDDPRVAAALARVPGRRVGFTLGEPAAGQVGVAGGWLTDRAFGGGRLIEAAAVRPAGTHNVANALAAAGLALAYGVDSGAVRDGLTGYRPQAHRNAPVATVAGVDYVDDSKATNPHAAHASLTAYPRVVWIAGGQLKGVDVDPLVRDVAGRLAGAVLLGVDRAQVADALARHAPDLPVVEVSSTDDGAMREVVTAAAGLARPGDTVLLAPAAASLDMFASYARRGDAFAAAVRELAGRAGRRAPGTGAPDGGWS